MKNRIRCLLLLIASAASLSAPAAQPAHTTRIEPQRNEHWWGCNADGHTPQPLAAPLDEEAGILTDSTEFLLSSTGRYLWSAHPFTVAIDDDGTFIITSDYEAVQTAKGGRTLREAYLYCVHKHIRPAVADSKALPFPTPLYDAGTPPLSTEIPYRGTLLLPDGWQAMQNLPDSALLTVTPYVPAAGWHYASLRRSNALLEDADGHPIIFHLPEGYFACLNIGEEAVMNAFAEQLATTLPAGKGTLLWFDSGQILFRIGNPALRKAFARNWHTLAERFSAVIRRSAYGTPTQWRPFAVSPADLSDGTMRQTLTRILNLGLSGCIYPFMTFTDSNGGIRDEGALLRATQLAAFLPISVIPTDTTRFADDANRRALQRTLTLRKEMNDYVEGLLRESLTTREPIIRLMEYQYPGQGFADCTDQFMLGPDCLVAPLLNGEPQRLVRLPRGAWTAADGTKYRGPRVIRVDVSDGCMPVFFRR